MSSVQFLGARPERPSEVGWRSEESLSDLELPGWQEFTGARARFFAGLRRAHAEHLSARVGEVATAQSEGTR